MSIEIANQLAQNTKELKCMGCNCTNISGDHNETSAPFYEVEVWNRAMTEIEGKEIYCSECLANNLTEEPETIYLVKQIWISDYDLNLRRKNKVSEIDSWFNNNKDIEGNPIDWIDQKTLTEMKFFRTEKLTNLTESIDLLHDTNKLEAFLAILTEEQRDKLYDHPILKNYDLLP